MGWGVCYGSHLGSWYVRHAPRRLYLERYLYVAQTVVISLTGAVIALYALAIGMGIPLILGSGIRQQATT